MLYDLTVHLLFIERVPLALGVVEREFSLKLKESPFLSAGP